LAVVKTAAFLCLISSGVAAQGALTPEIVVSDVNAVATYLSKEKMLNGDVMNIAAITCSTMAVAREKMVAREMGSLVTKFYPADELPKIERDQFVQFERDNLSKFGVSQQAITLIEGMVGKVPADDLKLPNQDTLEANVNSLESIACQLKAQPVAYVAQTASTETHKLGWALSKGVFGLGLLVVNVVVSANVPNPPVLVLTALSIGWGYTRVEESFFELKELSGSAFK
jgi:hypothetical protein